MKDTEATSGLLFSALIGLIRVIASGIGLFLFVIAFVATSGVFPDFEATINSGEPAQPLSVADRVLSVGTAAAIAVLLASPYRRVKPRWLRVLFFVGLLLLAATASAWIPEAVWAARSGEKDAALVPTVFGVALVLVGNLGAFVAIAFGHYHSPLTADRR